MKKITACIISVVMLGILMAYPHAAARGIANGMENAAKILVPSLFPFMVLSSFMIRSGGYEYIGRLFSPIAKIFRLPSSTVSAIILSFIGGFPVGARCVKLLYDNGKITHAQAKRMMDFCVCSGPSFLITALGAIMLGNIYAGVVLYLSQIISGIVLGIAGSLFSKDPHEQKIHSENTSSMDMMTAFLTSSADGAGAIVELTALVAIFAMVMGIIEEIGIHSDILAICLEVTTACCQITDTGKPLWILSAAAGYGGFCVHLQIFSILKDLHINKWRFEIFRIVNAILSGTITYVICIFYCPSVQTFAISGGNTAEITSTSIAGAFALIVMSGIFLTSISNEQ